MMDAARGGPLTDRERERRRRIVELRRTADRCFKCDAALSEVWLIRTYVGRILYGVSVRLLPYCQACAIEKMRMGDPYRYYRWGGYEGEPLSCETCGRAVYNIERGRRRYTACSDNCKRAIYVGKQRERRKEARGDPERTCTACGESFSPKRSDGRYCSDACRQREYRARRRSAEEGRR